MQRYITSSLLKFLFLVCLVGFLNLLLARFDTLAIPTPTIPIYGLFETSVINTNKYTNPFAEVELTAVFNSPSGRKVNFFGFYDGDGKDGETGTVWKQRFMPNEVGVWSYVLSFTDGTPGESGSFECVSAGGKPGPWRQEPANPRWLRTAAGDPFLPVIMLGTECDVTPIDWSDVITWAATKGYNTIVVTPFNAQLWGDGWPNVTAFSTAGDLDKKTVNYDHFNLKMWREWDDMFRAAGAAGIYIAPWNGPDGVYGGRHGQGTVYPPPGLDYFPVMADRFDTPRNLRVIRYYVARQGAFWNLAYWALSGTEVFDNKGKEEVLAFGEYLVSITPFGRMISTQDIEQAGKDENGTPTNLTWLAEMMFPSSRKLNTVQGGPPDGAKWQQAKTNNDFALDVTSRGFPVLATETLWEGQIRGNKPIRIIWGNYAAGMHTAWADWNYELSPRTLYGSVGKGWTPVKPLNEHIFTVEQLGVNCVGDEQLKIAAEAMKQFQYWKMNPHNQLVSGSTEAYCLAEPGAQYMVYAPNGGTVKLNLRDTPGAFDVKWLDPRTGNRLARPSIQGRTISTLVAPGPEDWVLIVLKHIKP